MLAGRRLRRHDQPRPRPRPHPRGHRRPRPARARRPARRPRRARPRRARAPPPSPADELGEPLVVEKGTHDGGAARPRRGGADAHQRHHRRRPSGSTSPTRPSSGCSSAAKHYGSTHETQHAAAPRRRRRELAARPPRRPLPGALVRHRRPLVLAPREVHRRGLGRRRAPPPAGHGQPRARPRCAWCSRPISIPPTWPASGRWCPAPRRSIPTTPTRSSSALRRARARHLRRHRVRRRRGGLEPQGPPRPLGRQAGERRSRPGRVRAARRRPATGDELPTDAEGVLEVRAGHIADGGWVRTTDLARLDADGFLYILGRADQAIIRGGFKVLPETIKAALERHPAVRGRGGDRPRRPPARRRAGRRGRAPRRRDVTADDLLAYAATVLARYELPTEIRVVDELPRTDSGKVDLAAVAAPCSRSADVDLRYSEADEAFRKEVRAWLDDAVAAVRPAAAARATGTSAAPTTPAGSGCSTTAATPGSNWPVEYGGRGLPASQQLVYLEEYADVRRPVRRHQLRRQRPRRAHPDRRGHRGAAALPPARGSSGARRVWCQGFSEPERRLRPRLAAHPGRARRRRVRRAPARRSGAPGPTSPTSASCSCAPTPTRRSTRASPGSSSTCTSPASRCGR